MIGNWFFWICGWSACLGGILLMAWALFWDRSRGRRRCPKCWYDMRGTDSLTCSECGHAVKRERQLHKTRRRPRWADSGLLLVLLGYALHATPAARRVGLLGVVPNTVIIPFVGCVESVYGPRAEAIERRFGANGLWWWQKSWLSHEARDLVESTDDPGTRAWGALLLFRLAQSGHDIGHAIPILCKAAHDDDSVVRSWAVQALAQGLTDAETAVCELTPLLKSPEQTVRFAAAWRLARMGAEARDAQGPLIVALKEEQDDNVRLRIAIAVCKVADDPAVGVAALSELLQHTDAAIRNAAALTLRDLGPSSASALPELVAATRDPAKYVRLHAVQAIGAIGPSARSAIPTLRDALGDEDWEVSGAARQALENIEVAEDEKE